MSTDTAAKDDLNPLIEAAEAARCQCWAPYSNFIVTAAVETTDGQVFGGANVENATLTLTVHAEMNAILAALRAGVRQRLGEAFIQRVYVSCPGGNKIAPCGLCRQSIQEFAAAGCVWIGEDSATGERASATLEELLPRAFGPADLGVSGWSADD